MNKNYPEFKTYLLRDYIGKNPFINNLKKIYLSDGNYELSPFENEYLLKNFRYKPLKFDTIQVEIGEITSKRIEKQYNKKPNPTVSINSIIGETDEWIHVAYTGTKHTFYFWLYRDEVVDLYEKICDSIELDVDYLNNKFKYSLFNHQVTGAKHLIYNGRAFLLDTVGAGKTHTSIGASIAVAKKVLIICIAGKQIDWQRELLKWGEKSKIIWGRNGWIDDDVKFTIIGCDVLKDYHEFQPKAKSKQKPKEDLIRPLENEGYDCIIVDEVQKFKSTTTKRGKAIAAITRYPTVEWVWPMSGTMIEKNEEFYNICRNMNIGVSDLISLDNGYNYFEWYPKFEKYMKTYCGAFKMTPKGRKRPILVRKGNTNTYELHQRTKHLQRRVVTSQVIEGFPTKSEDRLFFRLPSTKRKKYNSVFDDYLKKTGKTHLEDYRDLIESIKLRQYLAIQKVKETVTWVKNEIKDGSNILIFTNFIEEYQQLKKKLGNKAICIDSGLTPKKKQTLLDEYIKGKTPILIGNIESIGTGLNIQKADIIYFNSLPQKSDSVEQGIGRSYRKGREEHVYVYYPLFENTIEEDVYELVVSKRENRNIFHGEDKEISKEDEEISDDNIIDIDF